MIQSWWVAAAAAGVVALGGAVLAQEADVVQDRLARDGVAAEVWLAKPVLSSSFDLSAGAVSTDGNLDLQWQVDDAARAAAEAGTLHFEIEEKGPAGVREFAAGLHLSSALSGRDDGLFRYRVRAVGGGAQRGPWSNPVEVRVAHHPLWLAGVLFAVGAVVFVATAAFIVVSHRRAGTAE